MSYQDTYEAWLNSPALSAQEKAELESIRSDEKEKESRFFDQLSFGTAGLRGTMGVGLYRMNVHVIRHATQAFAQVILEEGPQAAARGVAICFDVRFAELFRILALEGAQLIVVPAAFNMTTGPAHWELLFRARALDNQCFLAGCAPARDETAGYVSYAHSLVCDPWGRVQAQAGAAPELLICDIDLAQADAVRAQIPVLRARRTDLYQLKYEKDS